MWKASGRVSVLGMAMVALVAWVPTAQAQSQVSLQRDNSQMVAYADDLAIRRSDGSPDVSVVSMSSAIQAALDSADMLNGTVQTLSDTVAQLEARIRSNELSVQAAAMNMSMLVQNMGNCVANGGQWNGATCVDLNARLVNTFATTSTTDQIQQTLNQLANLTGFNGPRCPSYPTSITPSGANRFAQSVVGHGDSSGSVRIITCNDGHFVAANGQSTQQHTAVVTCLANGSWSDAGETVCANTAAPTTAPTMAPSPPPVTVSCCWAADNAVTAIYVDGRPIRSWGQNLGGASGPAGMFTATANGQLWNGIQGFSFTANHDSVLLVQTLDNERGCRGGYNVFACSTPNGAQRDGPAWNFGSPSPATLADATTGAWWANRMKVSTIKSGNNDPQSRIYNRPLIEWSMANATSLPQWSNYDWTGQSTDAINTGNANNAIGRFTTFGRTNWVGMPSGFQCPSGTAGPQGPTCAGPDGGRTFWTYRYDAAGRYNY